MSAFNIRLQVGVVNFKYKTKQFSHDVNNIMSVRRLVFVFLLSLIYTPISFRTNKLPS